MDPGTNLNGNLIVDWYGYKIIVKLDNWNKWIMQSEISFETW